MDGSGDMDVPFYASKATIGKFSRSSVNIDFYTTAGQLSPNTKIDGGHKGSPAGQFNLVVKEQKEIDY